jgi:hypothetical protein
VLQVMFSKMDDASFSQPLPGGILRWYAILRTWGLSAAALERDTEYAGSLRSRFWSNANDAQVDLFEWVNRWAGTIGEGRALRVSWPASSVGQPATFADLVDKRVLGDWDDLHAIDRHGLLFFTVSREQIVLRRVSADSPEPLDPGEQAEPEFVERLQKIP